MKIKLSSVDVLQIAKALKCGWLDTDKIASFKSLVDGYNPPKEVSEGELMHYLDCLYKGWGYEPTAWEQVKEKMLQGFDGDLLERWRRQIEDGSLYRRMVKEAFVGLIATKALGGTFMDKEPYFGFVNGEPPKPT